MGFAISHRKIQLQSGLEMHYLVYVKASSLKKQNKTQNWTRKVAFHNISKMVDVL